MKKIFLSILIILIIALNNRSFSQDTDTCQKEIIRDLVDISDSMSRFITHIKNTVSDYNWNAFNTAVRNEEGLDAFDMLGSNGLELKNTYSDLGTALDSLFQKLIRALDPDSNLTQTQVNVKIEQAFNCYFEDAIENNVRRLYFNATGRQAPLEIGNEVPGPCEIALRTCLRNEEIQYQSAIRECAGIGLGAGGVAGPWWGVGAGLFCFAMAQNSHFNGVMTCIANYCDCANCH